MGSISINRLRMSGHHGVVEQERRVGNEFEINLRIDVPGADLAAESDNIEDTINYADVVEIIKKEMSRPSKLIENVAERIRLRLIERYGESITGGEISVAKLAPPISAQLESVAYTRRW